MIEDSQRSASGCDWPFPRIRPAEPNEIEPLMGMCRALHAENGIGPQMDEAIVRAEVKGAIAQEKALIHVVGEPGRIEGSICLIAGRPWYSSAVWWLEDRWNFVLPEYRKSGNADQMLDFAIWIADRIGVPLCMGIISNKRTEAKMRLYERKFGKPAGGFFLHGVKTGQG